jgi:hypothetical protein
VIRTTRNILVVICVLCLTAMAAQTALLLHILTQNHPDSHDSSHCQICRQLLLSAQKYATEPEAQADNTGSPTYCADYCRFTYAHLFYPESFNPRPPPPVC